ncbi:GYD domain-containing protein [Bradyrhizobium japonicum]|uniref:GYD domain-containing protein n=1 Tax=Bradyrhizobium japonicum TaxID=375 RepID=UPI0007C58C51|nr:GYD domain-containing protein [Bradyrhizobium japonicum]
MPLFITQGRFAQDAIKGMLAKPEDRSETVGQLFAKSGGKLLAYYMTFGEYDFLIVSEGPYEGVAISVIVAAGGVTDLKTTLAMTSDDMKNAFAKAGAVAASFRPAGAKT